MLTGWTRKLLQFLGFAQEPAARVPATVPAPDRPLPSSIRTFINAAQQPGGAQEWMMGDLAEAGIHPYDFGKWCTAFASGVARIYYKYGTAPSAIVFENAPEPHTTRYNVETQTIFISRGWVKHALTQYLARQDKTDPFLLSAEQMAYAYGVEEAFHHYQFQVKGAYYNDTMQDYQRWNPGAGYTAHPLEIDAEKEVRLALAEMGWELMPRQVSNWQTKITKPVEAVPTVARGSRT